MYSHFSFREVYRQIYGRKFCFTATRQQSLKHDFRPYILCFVQNVSFVSDVNHFVDLFLSMLLLVSGLRRYIAGYTVANS